MDIKIDIKKLAYLAKLDISDKEKMLLQKEMEEIIAFASTLSEIEGVDSRQNDEAPLLINVFREDECAKQLSREEIMSNSKCKNEKYFCIPQILE